MWHLLALLGAAVAVALFAAAAITNGATTRHLGTIGIKKPGGGFYGDRFKNYDFTEEDVKAYKVDWPVGFVFLNHGNTGVIKAVMDYIGYKGTGSKQHGRVKDNDVAGWHWSGDKGVKDGRCVENYRHLRLYDDGDDHMYNERWGFYVLGTAHIDHHECGFDTWFGKSEKAENRIANDIDGRTTWGVTKDNKACFNPESRRHEGNHIWQSNGRCTSINVN